MIDHCVNRENLVFATTTTNIPTTDWTPPKKTERPLPLPKNPPPHSPYLMNPCLATPRAPFPSRLSPPHSPPAVSEQAGALADSPASPRNKTPQQSSNIPQVKTKNEASTQVTPRRSSKKRQNKKKNNQKELDPNRQWDDATHHQVPGVPPPTAPPPTPSPAPAVPTVVINNHGERADQVAEDEGFVTVTSKKQRKKQEKNDKRQNP
ncbi:uncharacterized protein [Penaeus vannamei]|uniref:uncharacterized protein n=1 Tax=Penaeus vannamei TaxID=6689 RepID=UPI00387F676C